MWVYAIPGSFGTSLLYARAVHVPAKSASVMVRAPTAPAAESVVLPVARRGDVAHAAATARQPTYPRQQERRRMTDLLARSVTRPAASDGPARCSVRQLAAARKSDGAPDGGAGRAP